jgi:hypothetical protein
MAILTFSGAAPHLKQQEKWMGWSALQRARRLGFLINNSRFLPLVERERHPNLASKILGLALRRVAQDWQERWEQRPLVVESFVDESRFRGTCACGSRVVSGSASAPGRTTPRPRGATQKKLHPKPGGLSHVGREAHPTAPKGLWLVAYGSESGRAPREEAAKIAVLKSIAKSDEMFLSDLVNIPTDVLSRGTCSDTQEPVCPPNH